MRYTFVCLPLCFLCVSDSSSTEPPAASFHDVADPGNPLPSAAEMERLANHDPIAFLQECIRRYDREVQGYTTTLLKKELLDDSIQPSEVIDVAFREKPFSVRMKWKEGARRAASVLYVKGENNDKLLVKPAGFLSMAGIVTRDPYGSDAKKSGRYPLTEFGIKIGMQRTLVSWEKANKANALHVDYQGVERIKQAGNRPCWVLRRTQYAAPEEKEHINGLTIYVDTESWLQVGSVIEGVGNRIVGSYYFRDIKLNPDFSADTFTVEGLKR